MSFIKAKEFLTTFDLNNKIIELEQSSATVELAAKALNCEEKQIAKSIGFKLKENAILIVLAGDVKVDSKKYKEFFKQKAKMLTAEETSNIIGHEVGGVCPFGVNEGVEIYLDDSLLRFETVFPACGSSNTAIELSLEELKKVVAKDEFISVSKYI